MIEIRNLSEFEDKDLEDIRNFIINNLKNNSTVQMYQNFSHMSIRLQNGMERGCAAYDGENLIGEITILAPPDHQANWAVLSLFVKPEYRFKHVGTIMHTYIENDLKRDFKEYKLSASFLKKNKTAYSFFISKGYDHEGSIKGLKNEDDSILVGKINKSV